MKIHKFTTFFLVNVIFLVIISVIIVPNLIWAPGKSAEACRTAAASCLCTLVQNSTKVNIRNSLLKL